MFVLFRMYCRTIPVRMSFTLDKAYKDALNAPGMLPVPIPQHPVGLQVDSIGTIGQRVTQTFFPDQLVRERDSNQFWSLTFATLRDSDLAGRAVTESDAGKQQGYLIDNRSMTAGTRAAIRKFLDANPLTEQDLLNIFPPEKRAAILNHYSSK